ncbi:Calx-beta domain-containing protein [Ruminiclostridium josui]|uniref:Calx-beta domain-containing protein n=1 Tax=Ruminiclostridium josui TaxID=1499 RepID=UPI0004674EFB|nr:Calx-beta domain-containing protein [Ruminiclostridium josui]
MGFRKKCFVFMSSIILLLMFMLSSISVFADGNNTWTNNEMTIARSESEEININFQPAGSEIPEGYIPDYGDVYGVRNGYSYGWNVSYAGAMRDRNLNTDQKLDTLIMLYKAGKWEMKVENGFYDVTVCAGDAEFTSTPTVNVEGVNYWSGINLGVNQFSQVTKTVMVTDGKLTIDNGGTADQITKLNYVKMVKSDVTFQTPINIKTTAEDESITISWDMVNYAAGYEVEADGQSYTVTETFFNHQWLEVNTSHTYRVRAVNNGIKGTWSEPVTATTLPESPGTIKINFQPAGSEIPEGYISDYGEVYGVRNGYSYGWNVSYAGATRDRNLNDNQKLDTLIMLYKAGKWEMELVNGFYDVTVCAGDAEFTSTPTVNVEGVNYWSGINLGVNQFSQVTKTVIVTDGKLTIDNGGTADQITNLNYVKIVKSDVTFQTPINIKTTAADDSITISWDMVNYAAGYEVEGDGQIYTVTEPLFIHQWLEENTSHTYRVRAVNNGIKGTWSEPVTATTLPEALDISIGDTTVNEADGIAYFTVSLSGACNRDVAVSYTISENTAVAEVDYTSVSGTVVIPEGNTSVNVTVPIIDDTDYEENESFYLKLTRTSAGRIADSQGECIIIDNDSPPTVNLNISESSISENGGTSVITATLSNKSYQDVTVNIEYSGTAINGTDYIASGNSIVIPAGELSGSVTLTSIDNSLYEADKTIIVDISSVINGTKGSIQQVTATIKGDELNTSQYLSDLQISSGILSPIFNKNVYSYK